MTSLSLCFAIFVCLSGCAAQSQGNDGDYQHEPKGRREVEYSREEDRAFDQMVGNDEPRPRQDPTRNQVRSAYRDQKDDLVRDANSREEARQIREDMDTITFDPYVEYHTYEDWTAVPNNLTCCPPEWNYGCESGRDRMPCFWRRYGNRQSQWCCPFWPDLKIRKCKCTRCAILKPKCAKAGRCQRRYKETSFYAICYRNGNWNKIRYLTMELPSSCYCLARD